MAEITFTGNKKLIRFYKPEGGSQGSWDVNHSVVRGKKEASELSTTGSMNVSTFENRYENAFGSKIEIMHIKNGKMFRSLEKHNGMSLTEFNNWAKDNGCVEIKKEHPEWF
jgi:hypothetical protein